MTLSNPEKLIWPEAGVTKQDLLDHYEAVWPRMERFVVNRPLSLLRAPDGVGRQRLQLSCLCKSGNCVESVTFA